MNKKLPQSITRNFLRHIIEQEHYYWMHIYISRLWHFCGHKRLSRSAPLHVGGILHGKVVCSFHKSNAAACVRCLVQSLSRCMVLTAELWLWGSVSPLTLFFCHPANEWTAGGHRERRLIIWRKNKSRSIARSLAVLALRWTRRVVCCMCVWHKIGHLASTLMHKLGWAL